MNDFKKMDSVELEALINNAKMELHRRKTERANKLITKVCDALNELQAMGVSFVFEDDDGYDVWVFDGQRTFTPDNFKIPEVK